MGSSRRATIVLAVVPVSILLAAGPAAAVEDRRLYLDFEQVTTNRGSAPVRVDLVTKNGGTLARTTSTTGYAGDYPAYNGSQSGPRAVLRIRNSGTTDRLSPGTSRFTLAADFRLDAGTTSGTKYDSGDNIIQRGLAQNSSQMKVEVDAGRPRCHVKGSSGALTAWLTTAITRGSWYRVTCIRDGDRLTMQVTGLSSPFSATQQATGATGAVTFSSGVPLSVGGKLSSKGTVATQSDQFNGAIDNAIFSVG